MQLSSLLETGDLPAESVDLAKVVLENARSNVAWSEAFEKELVAYFGLEAGDGNSSSPVQMQLLTVAPVLCLFVIRIFV